jgi:hypothetical protein
MVVIGASLAMSASEVRACGRSYVYQCPPSCGSSQPTAPADQEPADPPSQRDNDNSTNGVTWDLPGDSGSADSKEDLPPAATARPVASARPAAAGLSFNDRVTQAVGLQQALRAQNARLKSKREELVTWDAAAQAKFFRAFGTTDDAARLRVVRLIDQQIERNNRTLAALAERLNLEFYVEGKQTHK